MCHFNERPAAVSLLLTIKDSCAINVVLGKVIASAFVYNQVNLLLHERGRGIAFSNFAFAE